MWVIARPPVLLAAGQAPLPPDRERSLRRPSGSSTAERHSSPVRVSKGDTWVPVDTTPAATPGAIRSRAANTGIACFGSGAGPLERIVKGCRAPAMALL